MDESQWRDNFQFWPVVPSEAYAELAAPVEMCSQHRAKRPELLISRCRCESQSFGFMNPHKPPQTLSHWIPVLKPDDGFKESLNLSGFLQKDFHLFHRYPLTRVFLLIPKPFRR